MEELSLNVLDVVQNSVVAGASLVEIAVVEETLNDFLQITISDNGCGMTPEQVSNVTDPFFTTRTSRSVGLGVPFFKMAAEMSGGDFSIKSQKGVGTEVVATFGLSHIDRIPTGDMEATITDLIFMNPDRDFVYTRSKDGKKMELDTRNLREILGDVPLNTIEVREWIKEFLKENLAEISG